MTLRLTKKRKAILDVLKNKREALSAAEIHALLPNIDLATIYRNLEAFAKEKLIRKLQFDSQEARFEYQTEPHHHAICNECEKVIHFKAPNEKITELLGIKDFAVDELEVTVRGVCNKKH